MEAPLGWIQELRVLAGPLFWTPAKVRFAKTTFLTGENAVGKTAICEWLAGTSDPTWALRRWRHNRGSYDPLHIEIEYFTPTKNTVGVRIANDSKISFYLNGQNVPFNPISARFVTIKKVDQRSLADNEKNEWWKWSDIQRFSSVLRLDATAVENILPDVGGAGRFVESIRVEEERLESIEPGDEETPRTSLMVKLSHHDFELPFFELSSSEQRYVLIELGIALAAFSANYSPTFLVLQDLLPAYDPSAGAHWFDYFASVFSSTSHLFQTIIEMSASRGELHDFQRPSWAFISLEKDGRLARINQFGDS